MFITKNNDEPDYFDYKSLISGYEHVSNFAIRK